MAKKTLVEQVKAVLGEETIGGQEELRARLLDFGFDVTQSTVSRTLKKLGVARAFDETGKGVYRLPEETTPPDVGGSLAELIDDVKANEVQVIVLTKPGCAGLVARHLDYYKPGGLLGTIAGDDAIFVAPVSTKKINDTIKAIRKCLSFEERS